MPPTHPAACKAAAGMFTSQDEPGLGHGSLRDSRTSDSGLDISNGRQLCLLLFEEQLILLTDGLCSLSELCSWTPFSGNAELVSSSGVVTTVSCNQ